MLFYGSLASLLSVVGVNGAIAQPNLTSPNAASSTIETTAGTTPSENADILSTLRTESQKNLAQVPSVHQLSDVKPTDWAFQALKSLTERYGCIVGYPDRTFRGNRAMTRYEFAAGLNACLDKVNELIASATADLATQEDLKVLQRLQDEFQGELATLRGRVDALESRTKTLESQQFSTTTKLSGEAIFSITAAGGGEPGAKQPEPIVNNRLRLNLTTSFTGKDALITGLQANNFGSTLGGGASIGQTLFPNDVSVLGSSSTNLSFAPQFPGYNPQNLGVGCQGNGICLYKLLYITPVAQKLSLFAAPAVEASDAYPAIIPFSSEGQGALSRFGGLNPVVRVSGGTSESGLASAIGFIYQPTSKIDLRGFYGNVTAALTSNTGFPGTPLGAGVFNGSYVLSTQLTLKPIKTLDLALNYAHSYHQINIAGTGLSGADVGVLGGLPLTTALHLNSFGTSLAWRFHPKVQFTAYGAYLMAEQAGKGSAYTDLASWMAGFYFPDAFIKGNSAGILFGSPLYRTGAGKGAVLSPANIGKRATPYQVEAFYNWKLNNYVSITPGGFVVFNPEGDSTNKTTGVGVVRTTFTF